jgi:N-acetylneuraminate synthase
MQCTTAYPTLPEQWGLNVMAEMRNRYHLPVGFSDHSATIYAGLAAATLGSEMLEFHVVFDKSMFGPDAKASLTISETKTMTDGIRMIEKALLSRDEKSDIAKFDTLKTMFGKSLSINKNLKSGHVLTLDDLESKKPGDAGLPAKDFKSVIGKSLKVDLPQWSFLKADMLQ